MPWIPVRRRLVPQGRPQEQQQRVPGQQAVRPNSGSHLLDAADLNVGSTQVIPSPLVTNNGSTAPAAGNPQKLIDLTAESRFGRVVTLSVGCEITQPNVTLTVLTGPIGATVQFGNGSGVATVEFDVQAPNQLPTSLAGYPATMKSPLRSGTNVSLPAGAIRAYLTNLNNTLPVFNQGAGQKIIGSTLSGGNVDPTCYAFVNYGTTYGGQRLLKTIYVANNSAMTPPDPLGGGAVARLSIPPFARKVYLYRDNIEQTTYGLNFSNTFGATSGIFVLGPGNVGPVVIPPVCTQLQVSYLATTGVDSSDVSAIFELEL